LDSYLANNPDIEVPVFQDNLNPVQNKLRAKKPLIQPLPVAKIHKVPSKNRKKKPSPNLPRRNKNKDVSKKRLSKKLLKLANSLSDKVSNIIYKPAAFRNMMNEI
jgi:hypothetical protein